MLTFNYIITDELGVHARPAAVLAKEAVKFSSTIKIKTAVKEVDAKRIMALMSSAIKHGDEIVLTFEGEDEQDAYNSIKALLEGSF